jgi:hypothetical protein
VEAAKQGKPVNICAALIDLRVPLSFYAAKRYSSADW